MTIATAVEGVQPVAPTERTTLEGYPDITWGGLVFFATQLLRDCEFNINEALVNVMKNCPNLTGKEQTALRKILAKQNPYNQVDMRAFSSRREIREG